MGMSMDHMAFQFIDLSFTTVLILFLVGFIGGMVSGFIGSGGAGKHDGCRFARGARHFEDNTG